MNNKLKVLSLFSGIGAFEKALERQGIDYELVNYCEVDKYAAESYSAIHNVSTALNLGDITQIDIEGYTKIIDLITHGSPCQSFSIAGKKEGGDEGSETTSSLMWYTVKFIDKLKPKYVIWENVKNVLGKANVHNFEKYLNRLDELGYNNYHKVLNSKDFGIPQNRERIFVVSVRKDIDKGFEFDEGTELNRKLLDYLVDENEIEERYYLCKPEDINKELLNRLDTYNDYKQKGTLIKTKHRGNIPFNITKNYIQYDRSGKGYNSQQDRGYFLDNFVCTIPRKTGNVFFYLGNGVARNIHPLESYRLMGFDDQDYWKAYSRIYELLKDKSKVENKLNQQAGNSIVVNVLQSIFSKLTT